jgi:hypothetical protein
MTLTHKNSFAFLSSSPNLSRFYLLVTSLSPSRLVEFAAKSSASSVIWIHPFYSSQEIIHKVRPEMGMERRME